MIQADMREIFAVHFIADMYFKWKLYVQSLVLKKKNTRYPQNLE